MKRLSTALMLAAGLAASVAGAAEKKRVTAQDARPDDLVCTYERTTGSHLKKRVCISRADREQRAREDQDAMRRLQRGGTAGNRD